MTLTEKQKYELESLIDHTSLADVISACIEIAELKAEHISSNWQDSSTASYWERAAQKLARANDNLDV